MIAKGLKIPPIMRTPVRGVDSGMSAKARLAWWRAMNVYRRIDPSTYSLARVKALFCAAQQHSRWVEPRLDDY